MKKINLTDYFEKIYIINLPERKDRLAEINSELNKINLSINHQAIEVFPAIKPVSAGGFESIGARGCFMSHLSVLKKALIDNCESILILEDDVNFSKNFEADLSHIIDLIKDLNWYFLYGGHDIAYTCEHSEQLSIKKIPPNQPIVTAHFVAMKRKTIIKVVDELEKMLSRKPGDVRGGPMHVDGAYSRIRAENHGFNTYAVTPPLAYQRASKTNIAELNWFDRFIIVRDLVAIYRKIKNYLVY